MGHQQGYSPMQRPRTLATGLHYATPTSSTSVGLHWDQPLWQSWIPAFTDGRNVV